MAGCSSAATVSGVAAAGQFSPAGLVSLPDGGWVLILVGAGSFSCLRCSCSFPAVDLLVMGVDVSVVRDI